MDENVVCSLHNQRERERERENENEKLKNNVVKDRNNYQHTYRSGDSSGSDFLFFSFSSVCSLRAKS